MSNSSDLTRAGHGRFYNHINCIGSNNSSSAFES